MSYQRFENPFDSVRSYYRRSPMPATITIIVINAVLFLAGHFDNRIFDFFSFLAPPLNVERIWTVFSYGLATPDFIQLVFGCLFLSFVGGSLERSWGTWKFVAFFFGLCAVTSLSLLLGASVLKKEAFLLGLWVPLVSLTVAWAAINPTSVISLFGVVPIQVRWIALFYVGVLYFMDYGADPILGLFVLMGPLVAYVTVRMGLMSGLTYRVRSRPDLKIVNGSGSRGRPLDDAGITMSLNPVSRFRAWQQRRKLAKLLQNSGLGGRDNDRLGR